MAGAQAKVPEGHFTKDVVDTAFGIVETLQEGGVELLARQTAVAIKNDFVGWFVNIDTTFSVDDFKLGLLAGLGLLGLELVASQVAPILSMASFAWKFSLSSSSVQLFPVISKVLVEIIHQTDLSSNGVIEDHNQTLLEIGVGLISLVIAARLGDGYLLAITMVDLVKNGLIVNYNPFI